MLSLKSIFPGSGLHVGTPVMLCDRPQKINLQRRFDSVQKHDLDAIQKYIQQSRFS